MNTNSIINELHKKYPGKTIVKNNKEHPTEIICEIEPTSDHPDYSIAIAVIDASIPHYHKRTTEEYEVIQGELVVVIDGKETILKSGDKITIKPGTIHWARGNETWVRVSSHPGWTLQDHFITDPH